jgi:hypothetical protein
MEEILIGVYSGIETVRRLRDATGMINMLDSIALESARGAPEGDRIRMCEILSIINDRLGADLYGHRAGPVIIDIVYSFGQMTQGHIVQDSLDSLNRVLADTFGDDGIPQRYEGKQAILLCPTLYKGEALDCAICIVSIEKDDEVYPLKCKHVYHKDCLDEWCRHKEDCPVCRETIPVAQTTCDHEVCMDMMAGECLDRYERE